MGSRKPMVAILGCGPTGLLAAHACRMRDVPFVIFSRKVKSRLGGAQFSHIPIPGLHESENAQKLTYRVIGDGDTYAQKVYGGRDEVPFISFDGVTDGLTVEAWPLVQTYDALWEWYSQFVVNIEIDTIVASKMSHPVSPFDVTFSSVPAPSICVGRMDPTVQHWFKSQPIQIFNEALNPSLPDMTIEYDGTKDHSYYRMSKIFSVGSTEWGGSGKVPPLGQDKFVKVSKPIDTNCTCHLPTEETNDPWPRMVRVGRFGTWRKGVLTMHAWNSVIDILAGFGIT